MKLSLYLAERGQRSNLLLVFLFSSPSLQGSARSHGGGGAAGPAGIHGEFFLPEVLQQETLRDTDVAWKHIYTHDRLKIKISSSWGAEQILVFVLAHIPPELIVQRKIICLLNSSVNPGFPLKSRKWAVSCCCRPPPHTHTVHLVLECRFLSVCHRPSKRPRPATEEQIHCLLKVSR